MSKNVKGLREKYKILFESIKDIVVILDKKGKIIDINPAVKKITGFTPGEIKGRHFKEIKFINSKSKRRIAESFKKRLRGIETSPYEIEGLNKDGKKIVAEINASPFIKNGEVVGSLAILRDITERKQTEKILKESEERFRNILISSPDAITITDLNGNITECNQATANMHGFLTKEELMGKSAFDLIAQRDRQRASENMKKTLKQGFIKNIEYTLLTKDGREFPGELSASVIRDSSGKPMAFMAITEDISERKQIDRAKTEFVSLASHQLRTPLTIMNWYSEMLLAGKDGKLNSQQKKYSEEIYAANQRLIELVDLLLNVSRIELGTLNIEPEPINLKKVANLALNELLLQIKNKKLKVKKDYDKNLPIINADPNIVHIIFQNLLSNAVKYIPRGGRVRLLIKKQKSDVLIKVSDTGYGIPKAQQSQIFTKFFQADNIREKGLGGNGLGLYIVKSVLEQSGGKIWFESEENKGSTFYVTIPLRGMKKKKGTKGLNI